MSLVQRGWLTSKRNTNSLWQNAPGEMDKRVRSVCVEIHSGIRVYIAHIRDFQNMWGSNMSKRDWVDSRLYRAANVADHPHVNCYRHREMLVQTFDPVFQPLPCVCCVARAVVQSAQSTLRIDSMVENDDHPACYAIIAAAPIVDMIGRGRSGWSRNR